MLKDAAAAMCDNFQTAQVFVTLLHCLHFVSCNLQFAIYCILSPFLSNVSKLISDCRASNTEILSGTLKYQIMSEEKLGEWKLQDSNEVVSDNLKRK